MKKIFGLLLIIISIFIFNIKIKADNRIVSTFPSSINSSTSGLMHVDANIYSKSFDNTGRAFCTRFWKDFRSTTCNATWWSQDVEKNKKIAVAVGAMINKARSLSGGAAASIDTNPYFYGEIAINYFLYNYNGKKSYNNVTLIRSWSTIRNRPTFKDIYSAGTTAYNNYTKIKAEYTNMNVAIDDNGKVTITAKLTCYDSKNKKVVCSARCVNTAHIRATYSNGTTLNSGTTDLNSSCPRASDGLYYNYSASYTFENRADIVSVEGRFKTKNTVSYPVAQEYYCGSESYQNLTPNMLKTLSNSQDVQINKKIQVLNETCNIKLTKTDGTSNLSGAKFELYDGSELIDSGVTGSDGTVTFTGLSSSKTYQYKETEAPSGYVLNSQLVNVTCGDYTVTNTKETGSLRIKKVDDKGNAVAGAKIKVYTISSSGDSESLAPTGNVDQGYSESTDGNDYDTNDIKGYDVNYLDFDGNDYFITTDTDKVITGLTVGETYYVEEVDVPEGSDYAIRVGSDSVKIVAGENVATLENIHSKFKISKQDITTKKELPGANVKIVDVYGNTVDEWTSTKEPHEVKGLADGEYVLIETTAPNGYQVAESITFTIEDGKLKDDEDNTLVMYDDTKKVDVPDTLSAKNILIVLAGMIVVVAGSYVFLYGVKKKDEI